MHTKDSSFTRRTFLSRSAQVAALAATTRCFTYGAETKVGESFISERHEIVDPKTGRRLIQLTSGDFFDMPMYYFIPTYGREGKTIVFQRYNHHTGEVKTLMYVNFWITHSRFYDDNRILFCHTATDYAILMTDLRYPGQYENIRTHSADGWPNHYNTTSKGVMYEMLTDKKGDAVIGGIYNPDTRARREYRLDISTKRLHVGRDPDARLWFFETSIDGKPVIVYFPRLAAGKLNQCQPLISGDYATYSNNQRSHYHPSVTPDRKHILFTGGDSRNQTNHLFLLDIADLKDTEFAV